MRYSGIAWAIGIMSASPARGRGMFQGSRIFILGLAALFLLTAGPLGSLLAPGAAAAHEQSLTVVAEGLHGPRGLAFGPGGVLYIAQAGDAPGTSAIFQVRNPMSQHPKVRTIVEGLPTYAGPNGQFVGVDGISVLARGAHGDSGNSGENGWNHHGHTFAIYAILGTAPQIAKDPAAGQLLKIDRSGDVQVLANVGSFDYEWATDHASLVPGQFPDANPYAVLALPDHLYVVDAATNTLDEVMPDGTIQVLAFFPNEKISDAVPTCVAQGPDGALYIGTLALVDTFVLGPSAKVYRIDPSQANLADPAATPMTVWASGLFPINGCAFGPDGNFYASELFTNPSHNPGVIFANPQGDVVKILWNDPITHISLTGGALAATGGVAVGPNGDVYVSDGTAFVAPGAGSVVRIDSGDVGQIEVDQG